MTARGLAQDVGTRVAAMRASGDSDSSREARGAEWVELVSRSVLGTGDEAVAALQRLPAEPSPAQRAAALCNVQLLVADAGEAIDRGRGAVDPTHPVHVDLIQARLAALRFTLAPAPGAG